MALTSPAATPSARATRSISLPLMVTREGSVMRARKRRRLKNRLFCAVVVPVRTMDQLRRM